MSVNCSRQLEQLSAQENKYYACCLYTDIAATMQSKMTCFVLAKHTHASAKMATQYEDVGLLIYWTLGRLSSLTGVDILDIRPLIESRRCRYIERSSFTR